MPDGLRRHWAERKDEELLKAYILRPGDFTPEGRAVLEEEIRNRGISQERIENFRKTHARPAPQATGESSLVTIAQFERSYVANLAKGLLESEGISVFLSGERDVRKGGAGFAEARLQVCRQDEERAREILSQAEEVDEDVPEEDTPEAEHFYETAERAVEPDPGVYDRRIDPWLWKKILGLLWLVFVLAALAMALLRFFG
ncbi:MAG: DUF2007 domain-containing protein [Acidobacteriota bacterium]|nr:MAG: DUF2007 domain-containing protein [Acidobacteriota bacterium]